MLRACSASFWLACLCENLKTNAPFGTKKTRTRRLSEIDGTRFDRQCQIRLIHFRHGHQALRISAFRSSPCREAVCRRHRLEGNAEILKYSMVPSCDFTGQCPEDQIPFTTA